MIPSNCRYRLLEMTRAWKTRSGAPLGKGIFFPVAQLIQWTLFAQQSVKIELLLCWSDSKNQQLLLTKFDKCFPWNLTTYIPQTFCLKEEITLWWTQLIPRNIFKVMQTLWKTAMGLFLRSLFNQLQPLSLWEIQRKIDYICCFVSLSAVYILSQWWNRLKTSYTNR